jgi:hypothetical protein
VRQFFTPRFWLTLLALAGLAVGLKVVLSGRSTAATTNDGAAAAASTDHMIDLVTGVFVVQPADGFTMVDGKAGADLAVLIDGTRTMIVTKGTPGEISCPQLTSVGQCTVAAELLGDAVLWFSIIPGKAAPTLELPGITALLHDNRVRLANGWVVRRAASVIRSCNDDTTSLKEFVTTFGRLATSTFNVEQQQIVRVTCADH